MVLWGFGVLFLFCCVMRILILAMIISCLSSSSIIHSKIFFRLIGSISLSFAMSSRVLRCNVVRYSSPTKLSKFIILSKREASSLLVIFCFFSVSCWARMKEVFQVFPRICWHSSVVGSVFVMFLLNVFRILECFWLSRAMKNRRVLIVGFSV